MTTTIAPTFTQTAELVGQFENGSPEWLHARMAGIGGSDIGTIAGLNRYSTPTDLWAYKTGKTPGIETTEPMRWGTKLEPVIIDEFEERHPEFQVLRDVGSYRSIKRPWQLANPDAIALHPMRNWLIEIKCARYPWKDGVPKSYQAQVQWYMDVLGLDNAIIAVLFGGNEYQEFHIEANPFQQEIYREKALEFLEYVYEDRAPDADDVFEREN